MGGSLSFVVEKRIAQSKRKTQEKLNLDELRFEKGSNSWVAEGSGAEHTVRGEGSKPRTAVSRAKLELTDEDLFELVFSPPGMKPFINRRERIESKCDAEIERIERRVGAENAKLRAAKAAKWSALLELAEQLHEEMQVPHADIAKWFDMSGGHWSILRREHGK